VSVKTYGSQRVPPYKKTLFSIHGPAQGNRSLLKAAPLHDQRRSADTDLDSVESGRSSQRRQCPLRPQNAELELVKLHLQIPGQPVLRGGARCSGTQSATRKAMVVVEVWHGFDDSYLLVAVSSAVVLSQKEE